MPLASTNHQMHILIVDDHELFREGLRALLEQLVPTATVTVASGALQALTCQANASADVVLLDWNMPGLHGKAAVSALQSASTRSRIVVLSGENGAELIHHCLEAGAAGFIPKNSTRGQFIDALRTIADGGVYLPSPGELATSHGSTQETASPMVDIAQRYPTLTTRQCDSLRAVARGLSNKLIARELGISDDTVKQHLSVAYQVLEVKSRTEAVVRLAQLGLRVA